MTPGCNCPFAIQWMAKKGGPHSKRMLASGLTESQWPAHELVAHLHEEPIYFFPHLPRFIVRQLEAHHVVFLRELREYGKIVSVELFKKHAAIENTYAKELLARAA